MQDAVFVQVLVEGIFKEQARKSQYKQKQACQENLGFQDLPHDRDFLTGRGCRLWPGFLLLSLPEILKTQPRTPLATMDVFRMDKAPVELQNAGDVSAQAKPGDHGMFAAILADKGLL